MDPVTVVGLALSAVGVVDFTLKVVAKCKALHKSVDGAIVENREIEQAHRHLPELLDDLSKSIRAVDAAGPLTRSDQALLDISKQCSSTATELREVLDDLRAVNVGSRRQRLSKAIKTVSAGSKLKQLQDKLEKFQIALDTQILVDLRQKIDLAQVKHSQAYNEWSSRFYDIFTALAEHKSAFSSQSVSIEELLRQLTEHVSAEHRLSRMHEITQHEHTRKFIVDEMRHLQLKNSQQETSKYLLQSLAFPEINARKEEIHETHGSTCQWIFEDTLRNERGVHQIDFVKWLEQGTNIYWIQGKAGSGKSTLMNYISEDPRTLRALNSWSAYGVVLTPTFFFWNSGSSMQKSVIGMLRSLLHQVIESLPHLACSLSQSSTDVATVWTEKKLQSSLRAVLKHTNRSEKICFFIDGLDEFDGEAGDLVELIKQITSLEGVKACISSRPWNTFQSSFKAQPQLRLEDFNDKDIQKFVRDKLDTVIDIKETLEPKSLEYEELIHDICIKAEGVFLWTRLAVASILRGKVNKDSLGILRKRLNELPPELEKMYEQILTSVDPVYRDWTTRLLYYVSMQAIGRRSGIQYMSILQLYFIFEPSSQYDDNNSAMEILTNSYAWYEQMRSLVNAATLGLVEIGEHYLDARSSLSLLFLSPKDIAGQVYMEAYLRAHDGLSFSHRTVYSFVEDQMRKCLGSSQADELKWNRGFTISALKCMIWVLCIFEEIFRDSDDTFKHLHEVVGKYVVLAFGRNNFEHLENDEIDALIQKFDQMFGKHINKFYGITCVSVEKIDESSPCAGVPHKRHPRNTCLLGANCLTVAASEGLSSYVRLRVLATQMQNHFYGLDLYSYLLHIVLADIETNGYELSDLLNLAQLLLVSGADPNVSTSTFVTSPWKQSLGCVVKRDEKSGKVPGVLNDLWIALIKTFIAKGADLDVILKLGWFPYRTGLDRKTSFILVDHFIITSTPSFILERFFSVGEKVSLSQALLQQQQLGHDQEVEFPAEEKSAPSRELQKPLSHDAERKFNLKAYKYSISIQPKYEDRFWEHWDANSDSLKNLEDTMAMDVSRQNWLDQARAFRKAFLQKILRQIQGEAVESEATCRNPIAENLQGMALLNDGERRELSAHITEGIKQDYEDSLKEERVADSWSVIYE